VDFSENIKPWLVHCAEIAEEGHEPADFDKAGLILGRLKGKQ